MAIDKKGFLLYADQKELFDQLSNEKAGELIKHIFSYVNDENPESADLVIKLAFTPIKQQLKRDLKRWEGLREDRSNAGILGNLKRYNPDIYDKYKKGEIDLEESQKLANGRKAKQSVAKLAVNVNDNVNVNVNVNDIDSREANFKNEILQYQSQYSLQMLEKFFLYWSEPNKSRTKMRFEQQKTWDLSRRLKRWESNNFEKEEKDTTQKILEAGEKLKQKLNGTR